MAVSPSYKVLVIDLLNRVLPNVRARSMFGGVGVYSGDLFFALIDDDTLYFKVDGSNRPDFEARGMAPFRPFGDAGETMQYYQVPEEVLEDPDTLRTWAEKALAVARQNKRHGKSRRRDA